MAPAASMTSPDALAAQHDFRAVLTRHVQTKARPVIATELVNMAVTEGDPVELSCRVSGTPSPEVYWYMNNKEIKVS